MKSKTSFFSKTLFYNDMKAYGWVGIIYTIYLFLMMPIPSILSYSNDGNYNKYYMDNIFRFNNFFINIVLITLPVLIAIILFRYLQVVRSYTIIHSYPYTRTQIFNSHILTGVVLLVGPLLINIILMIIINTNIGQPLDNSLYLSWVLKTSILSLAIFIISAFIGVVVGGSIWQLVFSYIFLMLPVGLVTMILYLLNIIVYGMSNGYYSQANYLSPLILSNLDKYHVSNSSLIVYTIYIIIFYLFALFLYKRRTLENISSIICFDIFKVIFKYGVTFCCMLAAGLAYCSWSRDDGSLSKFLIGGLIGAIVGYFISEMLLQKQVKVFGKYKGLLIYILVIAAVVVGFKMDLTGYEKKVPKAENVESIYFHSGYRYKFFGMLYDSVYDTDEMIDSVIAFHKEIIKQRPTEGNIVNISYELKNGKSIERTYRVDEGEMYDKYYKAMFESVEFKQNTFPLWTTKQEDLYNADIHPYNLKENIRIKDPQELKELITIVKDEILNESYEEMKESIELGRISFHGTSKDEQNISLNDIRLRSNYVELISWLREKGYYDDIVILPQDIKEIAIGMTGDEYERGENVFNRTGENNYMYIKDKDKIQQILDSRVNAVEMDDGIQDRIVYIQYNWSDNIQTLYISTNNEPEFIKK